jgi:DNA repair protein RecO (recombination protein O)
MALYRDTGVVLRVQKLGEADRIVTLLTSRHGKIRAVAKGVRRTKSRWGARLEPFNHVDVQCYTGRSLDIVTQAQTVDAFGAGLVGDYPRYTAGCAVLETADRLVAEEGAPALRVYLLLVGAIRALADRERDASLVLDAFLLRAMTHAGWAPAINDCARCAEPGPHVSFNIAAGGAVCARCRPPGSVRPSRETFVLLDALLHGDWPTADATGAATRRDTSGLVAAHLQWHLERQLRSLPLVERRATAPRPDVVVPAEG